MLLDKKVRESLFGSSAKTGQKYGKSDRSGGATWTRLTQRQRQHFELMARLLWISQRLHISKAEDRGHGDVTEKDTLKLLVARAEEEMMRSSAGIEQGEIDIVPRGEFECQHNKDYGSVRSPVELARGPWIRTIARHLYKLNPKLNASLTQDRLRGTQFSQFVRGTDLDKLPVGKNEDETGSFEQILLKSFPILQSLVVDESSLL
jgi:hypothetical protein